MNLMNLVGSMMLTIDKPPKKMVAYKYGKIKHVLVAMKSQVINLKAIHKIDVFKKPLRNTRKHMT